MGYSRKRTSADGKARYTAYFWNLKSKECSAGTFSNKKDADKAWQKAETKIAEGRAGDPARGRMRFEHYVNDTWLPNHQIEPSTREGYTYSLNRHILPEFGPMRMIDILPEHVRAWVTKLHDDGMTPATIRSNKMILSAIFTTALNDQVTFLHPCMGVKTPTVPKVQRTIITPEQFDTLYKTLPNADAQLLVETDIESGLRWGELTELRVHDLNTASRIIIVSRAVVYLNPKFHPQGKRFLVKPYPKDKEPRRLKLSTQIVKKIEHHCILNNLGPNDLLFQFIDERPNRPALSLAPNPDELGLTPPNDAGRQYKHGTLSGYGAGRCRCKHCKSACAIYRAQRRAKGKDSPRGPRRIVDTDGHLPRDWFRINVWNPAVTAAKLEMKVRVHDLRHAHASWLLAGGADLQVVKERLGHGSIATTERYLHTLPEADETALDALSLIRNRSS
jgi:integrase